MRRTNFHARFIEPVLNVQVQIRIYVQHLAGRIRVGVELVRYIEIIEGSLQYKWSGFPQHMLCGKRGAEKQLMNSPPWCVVTDRHRCVEDDARLLRRGTVVVD